MDRIADFIHKRAEQEVIRGSIARGHERIDVLDKEAEELWNKLTKKEKAILHEFYRNKRPSK